jgi:hypothetical protein
MILVGGCNIFEVGHVAGLLNFLNADICLVCALFDLLMFMLRCLQVAFVYWQKTM